MVRRSLLVTVILPTFNERDNVAPLIRRVLAAVQTPLQVLVVDDDSPDGTWQVVAEIAAWEPRVRLIRRTAERGLTSALWTGIQAAEGEVVAWMDCDLAMPPEVLPQLLERLAGGADIALGSRYAAGGRDMGHGLMARAFSVAINVLAATLLAGPLGWWRGGIRDWTSGFICARRAVFDHVPLRGDYGEYCIDLLARARRLGFRIEEVPYVCGARFSGQSKTGSNVKDYLCRGFKYVTTILRLALGQ